MNVDAVNKMINRLHAAFGDETPTERHAAVVLLLESTRRHLRKRGITDPTLEAFEAEMRSVMRIVGETPEVKA